MTHNEGGGQGFHKVDGNVQDGCDQVASAPQPPQQQSQGPLVHWEQFLHVRSIKVMLVENDDCTRHIVTALLRNCNYEVIEAANGYQAWKILEDLSNHIDIVLTEVVMPSFSGLGLLCKIMSHKTRKNIPVIMMSSHDSMGLVFKCLSKGAVDFLVKPIRKNELKNLWQHVWRKCHSSSGSGSESGTRAQKSVNSKGNLRYDDSGNKVGDDNGSTGDGSDDGGGTQSSWTKQAIELESPEAASPCNQIAEHPDSTCGLVIRPIKTQATVDSNDGEGQSDNHGKGKEIAVEVPIKYNGNQNVKSKDTGLSDHSSNKHKAKDSKMPEPRMENAEIEGQREPKKIIDDCNEVIVGELSLKRPRANKLDGKEVHNGCNTLRHSELSAFTRYKTTSNAVKGTPGITASTSQPDNRSNIVKLESTRDDHSDGYLIYQGSNEQIIPRKTDHQELRIEHIHHHHHVHHYHNIDPEQPLSNHDLCLNNLAADASHCGSSNIIGRPVENNLENYSLNKSASGSKYGSNVNLEAKNIESDIGLAEKSGRGDDASGNGGGNRIDHRKSAQREAALTKFRQKREVRCFQKKVRYQNRKRLAEQRPRARGQFVKGKSQ